MFWSLAEKTESEKFSKYSNLIDPWKIPDASIAISSPTESSETKIRDNYVIDFERSRFEETLRPHYYTLQLVHQGFNSFALVLEILNEKPFDLIFASKSW